jgi:hypothetical protein
MLSREIIAQEVADFTKNHPGEKFFVLDTDVAIPFGFLFVGSHTCTLGWQGALGFSSLDQEVLERLPFLIKPGWIPSRTPDNSDIEMVSLILEARELHEFDLKQIEKYKQYKLTIEEKPDTISFARYDVRYKSRGMSIQYSFTAENPQWSPTSECEFTVMLPKEETWSEGLLDWIIQHNVTTNLLTEQIDSQALITTILTLSHS